MKLLFIYDMPAKHAMFWQDGLWAALQVLAQDFDITLHNLSDPVEGLPENYDFVLGWGNPESPVARLTLNRNTPTGFCFGGGDIGSQTLDKFNVVFVENEFQLYKPNFKLAFGTNTDLFYPRPLPKIIDALCPGAFASWKHQEVFAEYCEREGLKGLACGDIQKNNLEESMGLVQACLNKGVAILDWIPPESLALLYNQTKEVVLAASIIGGCERAVLEAKASGVPVRILSDSKKLHNWNSLSSDEVVTRWNHHEYAKKLKEGILRCI